MKLTEDTKNKIIKLRKDGYTYKDIASELNISYNTVVYWLYPEEYRKKEKQKAKKRHLKAKLNIISRVKKSLRNSMYRNTNNIEYISCKGTIEEIVKSYTGFCSICNIEDGKSQKRLSVDHCHITGKFRGWLCCNCNTALGHLKDNINILEKMIGYLKNHETP